MLQESENSAAATDIAIETKDWGQLVDIVLRGEADLLIGKTSQDTEVQEFINNAQTFKVKVENIHQGTIIDNYHLTLFLCHSLTTAAVQSGSLKSLQEHLDRRKFCMARDKTTNVNILQKAVLLGHQSIVRYLATNFQELINLRDSAGRTALHYAAAVPENNFVYKTLIQRGADTSARDKAGRSPGQYNNKHKKDLNKTMLLNFMNKITNPTELQKKPEKNKSSKHSKNVQFEMNVKVSTNVDEKTLYEQDLDNEIVEKIDSIGTKFSKLGEKQKPNEKKLRLPIDQGTFDKLKTRVCTMSGGSLLDVLGLCAEPSLDPAAPLPLLVPSPAAYTVFADLLFPWIQQHHSYKIDQRYPLPQCRSIGSTTGFQNHREGPY